MKKVMNNLLKKILLFCYILFFAVSARAQDESGDPGDYGNTSQTGRWEWEEEPAVPEKKGIKNRIFEISLANVSVSASNDLVTAKDMLQKTAILNIDDVLNGFKLDFSTVIKPISLNFNWKDEWGFGLDFARTEVFGNVSLSDSLINLANAKNEKFGAGGAVFAEITGIPVFFHVNDIKLKIRPAFFMAAAYTEPGITYSYNGERFIIDYDIRIYTAFDMESMDDGASVNPGDIFNGLGFDLGLGVEYPLYSWLDVGVDIFNLPFPFAPARLNHYTRFHDSIFFDTGLIDIADAIESGEISEDAYHFPDEFKAEYGNDSGGKAVYRPFKMLFYANYRPFDSGILTLIPSLGFSINKIYSHIGAIEGGLSARCDLANIFITTLGINYSDRKWKNSIDFILNLRAFELDLGVSFQSPRFVKSFQGAGAGVNFGIKFGW